MAEQIILKVLGPERLGEVYEFLLEHFRLCEYCGDFFDGETDYCSAECDITDHVIADKFGKAECGEPMDTKEEE